MKSVQLEGEWQIADRGLRMVKRLERTQRALSAQRAFFHQSQEKGEDKPAANAIQ
jgi:hypothetical protein